MTRPPENCGDALLCVRGVKKYFGGVRAVDGVDLEVPRRWIVGLIGPNGSGKSTLFNVIAGVGLVDAGRIWFDGEDITGLPPHEIYKRGLVRTFQTPRLWQSLTVYENTLAGYRGHSGENPLRALLRLFWRKREVDNAEASIERILDSGLKPVAGNLSSDISGGQMKLGELTRALNTKPKMVMLDEPAAGINPTLARQLFERIVKLRDEEGITFLIIEHRLEILFDYVDYVYVMHQGKIIARGKPEEVVEDPKVIQVYLEG